MKSGLHRFCWFALLLLAITAPLAGQSTGNLSAPKSGATEVPEWQIDAGGKMEFDVASVKMSIDSERQQANPPLNNRDDYSPNGGLLTIHKFPLAIIIGFAYKLPDYETRLLRDRLPKPLAAERFDIEARAPGNPTEDQMRLMMQSLLADRFKLTAHFEIRQLQIYNLVLDKPGKLGPQLTPSAKGPCVNTSPKDGWPQPCSGIRGQIVSGRWQVGARNVSTQEIAAFLERFAPGGTLGGPMFDRTGLAGLYNFRVEFEASALPADQGAPPSALSLYEPFVEAMRRQLGLKLESTKGPVDVLVIDHIEQPTPN